MNKLIFVIDDEQDIREILKVNLVQAEYDVQTFSSAEAAFDKMSVTRPDLIILDIMMPGMDGFEFCKRLRSDRELGGVPVLFLSARSDEFDKVFGLELGGDDYMTKPFGMKELKSRVKALMRRASAGEDVRGKLLTHRGLVMDLDRYSVTVESQGIDLTRTEFCILEMFLRNPGKIFTRDNIIDSIKGRDVYIIDRTVDVHIMNLRKKLGPYKDTIRTVSGIGYGFRE